MTQTPNDRAYAQGLEDGVNGNVLEDLLHEAAEKFASDGESQTYHKGYDYGFEHRREIRQARDERETSQEEDSTTDYTQHYAPIIRELCPDPSLRRKAIDLVARVVDQYDLSELDSDEEILSFYAKAAVRAYELYEEQQAQKRASKAPILVKDGKEDKDDEEFIRSLYEWAEEQDRKADQADIGHKSSIDCLDPKYMQIIEKCKQEYGQKLKEIYAPIIRVPIRKPWS